MEKCKQTLKTALPLSVRITAGLEFLIIPNYAFRIPNYFIG